ncbi:MAG: hypothetical protein KBD07_02455, partial [Candidatus Omnitrophica bacterium]|nr:hypothetical protein [Candidatus Omnitrophota bacterium]
MRRLGPRLAGHAAVILLCTSPAIAQAADPAAAPNTQPRVTVRSETIGVVNELSGPGASVRNLPYTYDMTLYEYGLGGKQTRINGSGITTASAYPLTDGEALTTNTNVGLIMPWNDITVGIEAEFYALAGDRAVGRVFGPTLPWGDFERESGALEAPHFDADLYQVFLKGGDEITDWQFTGGTLDPAAQPEFARKDMNELKLGSLIWRVPITMESFFSKEDRRILSGRHPVRGVDFIWDTRYVEDQHVHLELFTAATDPTPLVDLERDAYGGRVATDLGPANVGVTAVYNEGLTPVSGLNETETLWAVDTSVRWNEVVRPYAVIAGSDHSRDLAGSHNGLAWAAGISLKWPDGWEAKAQYQLAEENYDLMSIHKAEHYPSNMEGWNGSFTVPVSKALKVKGLFYFLNQIDTANGPGDTIFGDPFFAADAASDLGALQSQRLAADWKVSDVLTLSGYAEHAAFRKDSDVTAREIDKDAFNLYAYGTVRLTPEWSFDAGMR